MTLSGKNSTLNRVLYNIVTMLGFSLARRAGNEKADASPAKSYPHLLDPTFVYLYALQPPSMFLTRNPAVGRRSSLAGKRE